MNDRSSMTPVEFLFWLFLLALAITVAGNARWLEWLR